MSTAAVSLFCREEEVDYAITKYDTELQVEYADSKQYRECLRQLFRMAGQPAPVVPAVDEGEDDEPLDDETRDEQDYDEVMCCTMMDSIYSMTKTHPVFIELYKHGAGTMLSEDPEIGLVVLYSYHYLPYFHVIFSAFLRNNKRIDMNNVHVQALVDKLTK